MVCSNFAIVYRIATALTLIIYEYVHLKDPGYVPHDGIFYTDQEEEVILPNAPSLLTDFSRRVVGPTPNSRIIIIHSMRCSIRGRIS